MNLKSVPNPAIHKLRSIHGPSVERFHQHLLSGYEPPPPQPTLWVPKNPDIEWPTMLHESALSEARWKATNFPFCPLPQTIQGVVNIKVWDEKIAELTAKEEVDWGLVKILEDIRVQLTEGASSGVSAPGDSLTQGPNYFPDPPAQLPRVVDALASFTKAGHVGGPLFNLDRQQYKVNPIMAINKPGGHIRVVGNFKYPPGKSFNDGIPVDRLEDRHNDHSPRLRQEDHPCRQGLNPCMQ